jgi:hypothetical protein
MKWLFQSIRLLTGFSESLTEVKSHKVSRYKAVRVVESPEHFEIGCMYLHENRGRPLVLEFICPCGCGDKIELSLIAWTDPSWRIEGDFEFPSIYPSVRRVVGCRSHFWVKDGKVYHARDIHYFRK